MKERDCARHIALLGLIAEASFAGPCVLVAEQGGDQTQCLLVV